MICTVSVYPIQYQLNDIFPLTLQNIANKQDTDQELQNALQTKKEIYKKKEHSGHNIIFRTHTNGLSPKDRIVIPHVLIKDALNWYHNVQLRHPGYERMYKTMTQHFWFPNIQNIISEYCKTCDICQAIKGPFPKSGQLAEKVSEENPFEEVQVDSIGPWKFKFGKSTFQIDAMTAIDPFSGLLEIRRIKKKTAAHAATKFYEMWIARYPRPLYCVHDLGSEYIGEEFSNLLHHYQIKNKPITSKNPQANSIIERVHLTMGNMLRSMILTAQKNNFHLINEDADDFVDTALAATQLACNSTVHTTTNETPGAFAYQRDMMLPFQSIANWDLIRQRRQDNIHRNYLREDKKRTAFDFQPGMKVMIRNDDPNYKLDPRALGPYIIAHVHTNGNVTIQKKPNLLERINVRRIKLYNEKPP